jgi:alkylation response protein AidB-like acyl-CoA dehydrogenase
LLGQCTAEAAGGLDLGAVEAVAALIEAGRALLPFPLAETLGAGAALGAARPEVARALAAGEALATVAWTGRVALREDSAGGGWAAEGALETLAWPVQARWLVLPLDGSGLPGRGALIDLARPGATRAEGEPLDLTCATGRVALAGYRIGEADLFALDGAALRRFGALLVSAEMLGAAEACLERAVAYLKERRQFGQPLGRFQAVKHIAADDALDVETMRNLLLYAAWAYDAGAPDAALAAHGAKALVSDAARRVAEHATQFHGGMGYTWELGLHFHMRRILRGALTHGSAGEHRAAIAAALLAPDAAGEALRTL